MKSLKLGPLWAHLSRLGPTLTRRAPRGFPSIVFERQGVRVHLSSIDAMHATAEQRGAGHASAPSANLASPEAAVAAVIVRSDTP